ncbi:MAG: ATP-binding protein [Muribaculaceae bacterium]|nr:ATP-binding protein [Muribaculaceae bacterium]
MNKNIKYAIGEQDFQALRKDGYLYIDKTHYIDKLLKHDGKYYFLARPRRFGKSLFLSALQYFFEGKRDLFKGLYIESINKDWQPHPVLRLDLNTGDYSELGKLESVLDITFRNWEKEYGLEVKDEELSQRFQHIIESVHEQTGMQVVILVDEYDKPLVKNLNNDERFEHYRLKLASVYSNFKSSAAHIRLVFLTGVSRFSKLSVFSDLNNLNDISFDDDFADICGVTEKELLENLQEGIENLAKEYEIEFTDALRELKENYDGYRFSRAGSEIYNPWSLLNCLSKKDIRNYWTFTGEPSIVVEALKRENSDLKEILNTRCNVNILAGLDLRSSNPLALLYQAGYLTIKDYDKRKRIYTLGIPNKEVKEGLMDELLKSYVKIKKGNVESVVFKIIDCIEEGKPKDLLSELDSFLSGIPYEMKMEDENNFQNAIYILLTLIGAKAKVEEHTSDGRIDLVIETSKYVYLLELKYDKSSKQAFAQIEDKQYARKFRKDHRTIFKIGANFSSETRSIEDPVIEVETII